MPVTYKITVDLVPNLSASYNGCGWSPLIHSTSLPHSNHEIASAINERFAKEAFEIGRLAKYLGIEGLSDMTMHCNRDIAVDIRLTSERELNELELSELRSRISGQLSDGYGEGFEQFEFEDLNYADDLVGSDIDDGQWESDEEVSADVQVCYSFDWKNVPVPTIVHEVASSSSRPSPCN